MGRFEKIISAVAFTSLFTVWSLSYADIYKYVDENGVIHFTNVPKGTVYKKIMSEGRKDTRRPKSRKPEKNVTDPAYYNQIINSKSREYSIEPSLIRAIITTESNWRPTAVSKKGAIGLMQLMPSTIEDMRVNNPFDPEENIEGGIRYLRFLIDRFNGDLNLALAAYNAGPNTVKKFGRIPPIPETEQYVRNVLLMYNRTPRGDKSTTIYKVIYKDGIILYTNTPSFYGNFKHSKF